MVAMVSAPRRDLMKARVRTWEQTRLASRFEVSAMTVRRVGAPFSPCSSVSGGSHRAMVTEPLGEKSLVTSLAGAPMSLEKDAAGSALVAEAPMNTGLAP